MGIAQVEGADVGVRVVWVESDDADTVAKINADRLGVTRGGSWGRCSPDSRANICYHGGMSSAGPTSENPYRSPAAVDARERLRKNSILTATVVLWTLSLLASGCLGGWLVTRSSLANMPGMSTDVTVSLGIIAGGTVGAAVGLAYGLFRVTRLRRRWDELQRNLEEQRESITS